MKSQCAAGLSLKGGKRDQFFFSVLEYYPEKKRWFLSSLLQVKDDPENKDGDEVIQNWIQEHKVQNLVVDVPLSPPPMLELDLGWPKPTGKEEDFLKLVQDEIQELLEYDALKQKEHPKEYERARNLDDEIVYSKNLFSKSSTDHILSRPFKRRLKKGFLPYWNRTLDFWVWCHYYDQMLKLFNVSFDSFGSTNLMALFRFNHLKKNFPAETNLYEASTDLLLIELLRSKIIHKKDLLNLNDMDLGPEAKLNILMQIEKQLGIFIYDHDLELLVKNPRAFESFLLNLAGKLFQSGEAKTLPKWTMPEEARFIVPEL
ncbi:MAG: hypothetical protein ACPGJV_06005 [Bacteriovoracaceae bacterium]